MSNRLLVFAISAAALGIGTLLWLYWSRRQQKDEQSDRICDTQHVQTGEVIDPQLKIAELVGVDNIKSTSDDNFDHFIAPPALNSVPSYEEIPSEIFLGSFSENAMINQRQHNVSEVFESGGPPQIPEVEQSYEGNFHSADTSFNTSGESAFLKSPTVISCDETCNFETSDAPVTVTEIHTEDFHSVITDDDSMASLPQLPDKLHLLTTSNLSSLTEEEAIALRDCLLGFGILRQQDEEARKHWVQIVQWILQSSAFSPNIRMFVSNGLVIPLINQLSECLVEDPVSEKVVVTIVQILVNLLPHVLENTTFMTNQEYPFWSQLKECLAVLCGREFQAHCNGGKWNINQGVPCNIQLPTACLQLLSNLSSYVSDSRYQSQVLDILTPHLSWLLLCSHSWNSTHESLTERVHVIRGLSISCLLHVSMPLMQCDAEQTPLQVVYAGSHALLSTKVPSNTFTCINRELNSHRFPELQEKWLRVIVNMLKTVKAYKDISETGLHYKDSTDTSATLFSCISDSSLSLQTTLFLLKNANPDLKEVAEKASSLLSEAL